MELFCDSMVRSYIEKTARKVIVFHGDDSAQSFFVDNPTAMEALKIRIDGGLISGSRMRCDYGLGYGDAGMILIEFKGSDLSHAYGQLAETVSSFREKWPGIKFIFDLHIVANRIHKVHRLEHERKKAEKKCGTLIYEHEKTYRMGIR